MTTLLLANTRGRSRDFQAKKQAFQQKLQALDVNGGVRGGRGSQRLCRNLLEDARQKDVHKARSEHTELALG